MSEMSRDEAIKELIVMNSLYGMTPRQRRALLIMINCTQKLQKIENILKKGYLSKEPEKCERDGNCYYHAIKEIEQIWR